MHLGSCFWSAFNRRFVISVGICMSWLFVHFPFHISICSGGQVCRRMIICRAVLQASASDSCSTGLDSWSIQSEKVDNRVLLYSSLQLRFEHANHSETPNNTCLNAFNEPFRALRSLSAPADNLPSQRGSRIVLLVLGSFFCRMIAITVKDRVSSCPPTSMPETPSVMWRQRHLTRHVAGCPSQCVRDWHCRQA